ncbi:hypothetical protein LYSHEL_14900 [Lysobacter helvus]|uniref:Uncharacterized protein n=2 Tax=Lysobacteraceae TaxID=32033 RepID=A0ABM7Q592_9GAMM|nr:MULTISPECIES: hypothetical protein [Lysobacter]BCT92466.1 hypothetical protein LYSCAS_14900 [Lysobacter caseinilyticus]BCT95619.1 hypothetical protein LYSHEL_14900 [Lysobacter helvus]
MICIRANLVSGPAHARFPPGTKVGALLFVQADDDATAEDIAGKSLAALGWASLETERLKTITDYAQFDARDDVVGEAFRDARSSGFGHILFPEPGA